MDNDGNLRFYGLNNLTRLWSVTWEALSQLCYVHGLCGRNVEDDKGQESELARFARIVKRKIHCGDDNWIEDIVDPRLKGEFSKKQGELLVKVALSCVEED
ncbi:hypothetical protein LguiA_032146 [Lonicera macranthoides]